MPVTRNCKQIYELMVQVYLHFSQRRRIKMETLLILSCVLIILAIPFGIKESIAVKKVRIEKTAKLLGYNPIFDK